MMMAFRAEWSRHESHSAGVARFTRGFLAVYVHAEPVVLSLYTIPHSYAITISREMYLLPRSEGI